MRANTTRLHEDALTDKAALEAQLKKALDELEDLRKQLNKVNATSDAAVAAADSRIAYLEGQLKKSETDAAALKANLEKQLANALAAKAVVDKNVAVLRMRSLA